MEWLPLVPILLFVPLFLLTALPRVLIPFELEWNEGHSAEQAWRFAMGLPLYPAPEKDWVPYMYAPLYHVLHGWLMWLTGVWSLAWGRLISLVSVFFIIQGIFFIIHNHTRRLLPALAGCLLFLAYYKPTGFWYDIVRVDSLSLALVVWGMYFTLKKAPREWEAAVGLILLALATWAKQTNGVVAVACTLWIVWQRPRGTILTVAAIVFVTANAVFYFLRGGSDFFIKYVYTNAILHPSMPHIWFPGYLHPNDFWEQAGNPTSLPGKIGAYIQGWSERGAPTVWRDCLRHAWIPLLFLPAWLVAALVRRQRPRGLHHVVPAFLLALMGFQSFAKFGGYVNNFMPVYLAVALLFGLSLAGLARAFRTRRQRAILGCITTALLLLQIFQPWNMPAVGDPAANNAIIMKDTNRERLDQLRAWTDYLNSRERALREGWEFAREAPEIPRSIRLRHFLGRVHYGGLTWFPSHQQPNPESQRAFEQLLDWLADRQHDGEPVLVVHHQWYGILTGHGLSINIDMVRCAHWTGDPIPPHFLQDLRTGRWPHLLLATERTEWDWLAGNVADVIRQHYEYVGPVEALSEFKDTRALVPVTGAEIRPIAHWKYRAPGSPGTVQRRWVD